MTIVETPIVSRVAGIDAVFTARQKDQIRALKDRGVNVLSVSGAPLDLPAEHVLEAARAAVTAHERLPSNGLLPLREAISDKLRRENGIDVMPDEVLVTAGAMQGLFLAIYALAGPGDEVIVPVPCFFAFHGLPRIIGAHLVPYPLREEDGWALDPERLERSITERTRTLILNTPHNPTGYMLTPEDLDALAGIAERWPVTFIVDESHEKMPHDGRHHRSPGAHPGLRDRVLTVHSFTKSYSLHHWRMGYVAGRKEVIDELRKLLEWTSLVTAHVPQYAALAALTGPQDWIQDVMRQTGANRDLLLKEIAGTDAYRAARPQGGSNLFLNVSSTGVDSQEFSRRSLGEYGVPSIPGPAFGLQTEQHVRLQFCGRPEDIREMGRRLVALAGTIGEGQG